MLKIYLPVAINFSDNSSQGNEDRCTKPFHFQDLISDSSYSLSCNSYVVSSENLVQDQLMIP